jgi:mRNA-degrading endonuclease YafQ of YafQ-DinJ toxin-antitoxin module
MRKIIGFILHRSFKKSYAKQSADIKKVFKERINLFLIDPVHPLLNNRALHGKWIAYRSVNITGDIRAIYKTESFIAIFVEIGTHNYLYGE